jgi:hypothetical protein
MIGRKRKAVAAVENDGAVLRHEIAGRENIVDALVSRGRGMDVRVLARPGEADIAGAAIGESIVKSIAVIDYRAQRLVSPGRR